MLRRIQTQAGHAVGGLLVLTGVAGLTLATTNRLTAQGLKKSDSKVKATATTTKPDPEGKQVVTVTLEVDKGWHLYANPVRYAPFDGSKSDEFSENKTVVTVATKLKPQAVKVEYPPGTLFKDTLLKASYWVYEDRVTIRALVQRAAGDAGPLQVTVRMNACDSHSCLAPGEIKLTVP
jgi:hypothetical protein